MGITEILLLVLGISVYVLSFVLPEKKAKMRERDVRFNEAQIRKMLEEQMTEVRNRISDVVEETINYAVEKTERSMERVSNEKIMAVNEYSDTVLEAIHKNHEEVVFLYDMLNDKQQGLKDAAAEAEATGREVLRQIRDMAADVRIRADSVQQSEAVENVPEVAPSAAGPAETMALATEIVSVPPAPATGIDAVRAGRAGMAGRMSVPEKPISAGTPMKIEETAQLRDAAVEMPMVAISFADTEEDGKNSNEKILSLHRAGKSNVAIAKELGLGVGEVKLVIDLFKGV